TSDRRVAATRASTVRDLALTITLPGVATNRRVASERTVTPSSGLPLPALSKARTRRRARPWTGIPRTYSKPWLILGSEPSVVHRIVPTPEPEVSADLNVTMTVFL